VFGAALASELGDGVIPVALAFAVLDLTGSPTDLGIVLGARTLALVAALLIGGVLADRIGQRAVMIGADLVRLAGQATIGVLLVTHAGTVWEIAASQALLGAASGFFNPASSGLLPAVAGEHLQEANALRGMAMAGGNIIGPLLGAALVLAAGPGEALLLDAASYGVSALLLSRVTVQRREAVAARSFLSELREGFAEVRSRTWVWTTVVTASLSNALAASFPVLGAVVAKRELGGAGAWGAILTAQAVGFLIGGTTLLRLKPRRPLLVGTLACATAGLPPVLLAAPAPVALIAVAAGLAGIGAMVFNTLWETTLQQHVPVQARSRVSSYDWFGSLAIQPLGYVLIGPLAGAVGVSTALYVCGALEFALVVALASVRDVRTLPPLPVPLGRVP